jgi:hypothetical protein
MANANVFETTMYEMLLIQLLFFLIGYVIGLDHNRRMEWFSYLWHIFTLVYLSMLLKFITFMIQKYIDDA